MSEIKNCPCCNGTAKHWFCTADGKHTTEIEDKYIYGGLADHHIIRCSKCGLQTKVYGTNRGAFNAWNRREG